MRCASIRKRHSKDARRCDEGLVQNEGDVGNLRRSDGQRQDQQKETN